MMRTALGAVLLLACSLGAVEVLKPVGVVAELGSPSRPGETPGSMSAIASTAEGGVERVLLRAGPLGDFIGATRSFVALVHPGTSRDARDLRLIATDTKGRLKELGRVRILPGMWQPFRTTVTFPADTLHDLALATTGETFWVGATCHDEKPPRLSDTGIHPNPLLAVTYEGSKGLSQVGRILFAAPLPGTGARILLPGDGNPGDRSTAQLEITAIATGWNTLPPPRKRRDDIKKLLATDPEAARFDAVPTAATIDADSLVFYATPNDLGPSIDKALKDRPQILILHLQTARSPGYKIEIFDKLVTAAHRQGTLVVVIFDARPSDETRIRTDWQRWITQFRAAMPGVALMDLDGVATWYQSPDARPTDYNVLLDDGSARFIPLADGFADYRARIEWVRFDARDEAEVSNTESRIPGP